MCERVTGAEVPGMDLYDAPMDIDDLAFMSLIACLDESTEALMDRMRALRELSGQKRALNDEIDRLSQALEASGADSDDDKVKVPGGMRGQEVVDPDLDRTGLASELAKLGDPGSGLSAAKTDVYTRKQVQDEIERLRRQLEDLGSSSELMLIDLNRLMSKRNEAIQLTSNILASTHQSAMAVIANFKG
jgi:chromosome segregation ATPase